MTQVIKWFFLFLLIGLPVSIYLFLQTFGENKFEIEIFYEDGIIERVDGCESVSGQHYVPNPSDYDSLFQIESSSIIIYNLGFVDINDRLTKSNHLKFLEEKVGGWSEVKLYTFNQSTKDLYNFIRCGLNLEASTNRNGLVLNQKLVLVDSKNRIRGYYDILDRQEVDRLITEIEILLME